MKSYFVVLLIIMLYLYLLYKLIILYNKYKYYYKLDYVIQLLKNSYYTGYCKKNKEQIVESLIKYFLNNDFENRYVKYQSVDSIPLFGFLQIDISAIAMDSFLVIATHNEQSELRTGDIINFVNGKKPFELNNFNFNDEIVLDVLRLIDGKYVKEKINIKNGRRKELRNMYKSHKHKFIIELSFFDMLFMEHVFNEILKKNTYDILILDLRNNSGGSVELMKVFLSYLLPLGSIAYYISNGFNSELKSQTIVSEKQYRFDKIIVCVGSNTSSSAEIMAVSLKENLGAIIVGNKTFGKGIIQTNYFLSDNSKITIPEYEVFGPNKTKINEVGVEIDEYMADHNIDSNILKGDEMYE